MLYIYIYIFCRILFPIFKAAVIVELSEEEREKILSSSEFQNFFDRASRMMERAICETDVTFDYGRTEDVEG